MRETGNGDRETDNNMNVFLGHSLSLTSLRVMLYRAEKPSLATAMSVWKERDSRPEDDWISGGILVPQ